MSLMKKLMILAGIGFCCLVAISVFVVQKVQEQSRRSVDISSVVDAASVALDPKAQQQLLNAEMAFFEALKCKSNKDYEGAHRALEEASDGFSSTLGTKSSLTFGMLMLQGQTECDFKKWKIAEDVFQRALDGQAVDPKENGLRMMSARGWLAYVMRRTRKVEEEQALLEENVRSAEEWDKNATNQEELRDSLATLAHAYFHSGDFDDAAKTYSRLLDMTEKQAPSESAEVLGWRSYTFDKQGKYKEAIADLDRGIEIAPRSAELYSYRGNAYVDAGMPEKALADYEKCIELDPKYSHAYLGLAQSQHSVKRYKEAIESSTKAIELSPKESYGYLQRAGSYAASGNYLKAIEDFAKAKNLDANDVNGHMGLAAAYRSLKNYPEAIRKYNQVFSLFPDYYEAFKGRGLANQALNEKEKAIDDYTNAIRASTDKTQAASEFSLNADKRCFRAEVLQLRGNLYKELGKTDLAEKDLERAKHLDEQFKLALK